MGNPPFVDDFRIEPSSSSPCLMTKGYTPFWKKLSHNSGRQTVFSTRTSGISAQASCKTSTRSAASPLVLVAAADDDDDDHGNLVHWLILYMFLYIYIIHICKYCIYIYIKIPIVLYIDRIPWSDLAIPWLQRNISRKILWLRGRNHVFLGMFPRSTIQKDCTCWCFLCNKYFMVLRSLMVSRCISGISWLELFFGIPKAILDPADSQLWKYPQQRVLVQNQRFTNYPEVKHG